MHILIAPGSAKRRSEGDSGGVVDVEIPERPGKTRSDVKHDKTSSRSRPWIYPYELDIDALLNISMMSPILPADVALFPAAMSPKAIQVEVFVCCISHQVVLFINSVFHNSSCGAVGSAYA